MNGGGQVIADISIGAALFIIISLLATLCWKNMARIETVRKDANGKVDCVEKDISSIRENVSAMRQELRDWKAESLRTEDALFKRIDELRK